MIVQHHLVFGKKYAKEETAIWKIDTNIANQYTSTLAVSTRSGSISVNWGDGSINEYTPSKMFDATTLPNSNISGITQIGHSYTSYTGDVQIKLYKGLSDMYSFTLGGHGFILNEDWGVFVKQFTDLYSINIDAPHGSNSYINGDASQIPDSVEKFYIRDLKNSGNFYMNVSNFSNNSKLKEFKRVYGLYGHNAFANIYGDLSKLPPQIQIFTLVGNNANTFTYTAGKTWASSFDTLNLGNGRLELTDTDNLLIDMNNSITTAIGSKVINLANCARRPFSNKAISELQAKGFTVTTNGVIKFVGDLATIPLSIDNFVLVNNSSSDLITYTAGRSWVSSFDTLNLGNGRLELTDTDNLLIDMNNSITTAIGSKVINLANCLRSSTSDTAVSGLQSKGFTVTVGLAQQFTFDLGQNVTINGSVTRAEGHDGRLNAIQFGSGNLVSADNLPISDVWSVAFWMKTTQTATCKVMELTANANNLAGFYLDNNGFTGGRFTTIIKNSNYNLKTSASVVINNGSWNHFVVIMNRAETTQNEIKVYINKILQTDATHPSFSTDSIGNFVSDKLYIGGRGTNYANPFNGVLSPVKAFNYALTQTEIDNLYNE